MGRFKMPKNASEILQLVEDANHVHDEKVKLELLVNGMLEGGKTSSSKASKSPYARPLVDKKSPSAPNPWSSAMSVDAVSKHAASKPAKPSAKPTTKAATQATTDSDDDSDGEPLQMKPKPGEKGAVVKKKKVPKEEKTFKKMTAYNVFVGHESNRLREICKEKGTPIVTPEDKKEMMSKVGELWKACDAENRVKWQLLADERNAAKLAARELGKGVQAPAAANGGAASSGNGDKASEAEGSDDE